MPAFAWSRRLVQTVLRVLRIIRAQGSQFLHGWQHAQAFSPWTARRSHGSTVSEGIATAVALAVRDRGARLVGIVGHTEVRVVPLDMCLKCPSRCASLILSVTMHTRAKLCGGASVDEEAGNLTTWFRSAHSLSYIRFLLRQRGALMPWLCLCSARQQRRASKSTWTRWPMPGPGSLLPGRPCPPQRPPR